MQVDFYQLAASPLERVLPRIAERVLAGGGRLLIVAQDERDAARIDAFLWDYAPDSFLPHGRGGAGADGQPVLIAGEIGDPANGARNVALADGLWRDAALEFDRAFLFFDADAVEGARAAWRSLGTRDGVERNYWRQDDDGRWEKQA